MILAYLATAAQSLSLLDNLAGSSIGDFSLLYLPVMSTPWGPLRAVLAAFMHLGPGHLALNLLLLFLVGRELEQFFGSRLYLLLWFISAIGASTMIVWLDPIAPTVGASGVCYSLMVLLVYVVRQQGGDLRGPIVLIAANLAYTLMTPTVSLWGHVGGLCIGTLLVGGLLLRHRWIAVSGIGLLCVVALLYRVATFTTSGFWSALI